MNTNTTTTTTTTTNQNNNHHYDTTTSSSTTTRVRAREETEIRVQLASIEDTYKMAIGSTPNNYIISQAERLLRSGVPYEYFAYALQETAFAPRPSWRYTMAIVARLEREQEDPHALLITMALR